MEREKERERERRENECERKALSVWGWTESVPVCAVREFRGRVGDVSVRRLGAGRRNRCVCVRAERQRERACPFKTEQ